MTKDLKIQALIDHSYTGELTESEAEDILEKAQYRANKKKEIVYLVADVGCFYLVDHHNLTMAERPVCFVEPQPFKN
jgi:hypothetical protein